MNSDEYMKMSCPNCESQYAVDFMTGNVEGEPDFCPFCGEEIPEENLDESYEEDEDSEEDQW